ncbi:AAA family ATPase [Psychrobacter sp. APC 3279]|uniref:AAA family ATPase n=1 Tax=Psychrobacter sp. APC 3279 TaxID=3035189 RepID=UPI0025B32F0C|nr:AAA family ATPase [Psychrobacter sp. APC 3279]MDN3440952.1 AAA family ATPase [Psychrobacter sp. APC 3279]
MLQSIRLRNLRSFADDDHSPYVDLKPLTVLIGKNSSGKSSFLRSLPLLRQSVEANTTGPILWYSSYVDFGAFSEAKKFDSKKNIIYFDFKFDLKIPDYLSHTYPFDWPRTRKISSEYILITVKVGVTETNKKTVAKELILNIHDSEYKFIFKENQKCDLFIDDNLQELSEELRFITMNHFLPLIITASNKSEHRFAEDNLNGMYRYFSEKLYIELKKYFQGNTSASTIKNGIARIGVNERSEIKDVLEKVFKGNKTFIRNLEKKESIICETVYGLTLSANISSLLSTLNQEMERTFSNVKYIAPLRATAERYYRHQDLQVKEIDHTGSNLAMLLRSFSTKENERFAQWTSENFGFKVRVEELGLHYALQIQTEDDPKEYNINDMGFGFSQILPIVASIWMETSKPKNGSRIRNISIIFAIEQPELHLHPEYQAKLAKMFVLVINAAKEKNISLKIIFETHSNTMIDTLGDCIEDGDLEAQDVNIVLFAKEFNSSTTNIKFSHFNNDGFLEEWPIGFFSGRR